MTRRELATLLAFVLVLSGVTLWGVISLIDHYAFTDDLAEVTTYQR